SLGLRGLNPMPPSDNEEIMLFRHLTEERCCLRPFPCHYLLVSYVVFHLFHGFPFIPLLLCLVHQVVHHQLHPRLHHSSLRYAQRLLVVLSPQINQPHSN
ncbi:hypothetical protein VIGAN_04435000, partial [Vigna angularis var. angularis]